MCFSVNDTVMLQWLRQQVRVVEAWRDELTRRPELDVATVQRLEQHYAWLTAEIYRLEAPRAAA